MRSISDMKLAQKLPLAMIGLAVSATLLIALIGYFGASVEIEKAAKNKLDVVAQDRAHSIGKYMETIDEDLRILASNDMVVDAVSSFTQGWNALGSGQKKTLQAAYVSNNPNPAGEKDKLDAAPGNSLYNSAHAFYHP